MKKIIAAFIFLTGTLLARDCCYFISPVMGYQGVLVEQTSTSPPGGTSTTRQTQYADGLAGGVATGLKLHTRYISVVGEGRYIWANIQRRETFTATTSRQSLALTENQWFSLGGCFGYDIGRFFPYFYAGWGSAECKAREVNEIFSSGFSRTGTASKWCGNWILGGGADFIVRGRFSLGATYRFSRCYNDFSQIFLTSPGFSNEDSYRFSTTFFSLDLKTWF